LGGPGRLAANSNAGGGLRSGSNQLVFEFHDMIEQLTRYNISVFQQRSPDRATR